MAPPHRGLSKGINQGLSKGINKRHVVTKRQLPPRPSDRKGVSALLAPCDADGVTISDMCCFSILDLWLVAC
jgi:hypothetical protein